MMCECFILIPMSAFIPRLYVEYPLAQGKSIALTEAQTHYLVHVLRLGAGAKSKSV